MEIKVTKLKEVLELMKPVVPRKPAVKSVACLSLGNGKAVATDMETMSIANLPEANEPMLLPYSAIAEMLKYVPGNETLKIELKGKMIYLAWKDGNASYPTEDFMDFPIMPEMSAQRRWASGRRHPDSGHTGRFTLRCHRNNRPTLNGVTLVLGTPIEVAAGDGFRAALQVLGLSFPIEEKVIIPAHGVAILDHVFKKTPRTPPSTAESLIKVVTAKRQLRMSLIGDNKLRLDFGTTASVIINLIVGKPPEWLALIPKGDPILQSQIFAPQLEAAAKRVRDIARDGSGAIRMEFADGKLKVSAKGSDQEISSTIDTLNTQGETTRTALNQKYLLDFLSGKQGIITFYKYTDLGPVVFEYQKSPRVLIMPMSVQWGDETPPAERTEPPTEATDGTSDTEVNEESESSDVEDTAEDTVEEETATE